MNSPILTKVQPWRLVKSPPSDAFANMAIDEAIFELVSRRNSPPTVRFYAWNPPAVSVGYFQDSLKEVDIEACRDLGIDVVRRLTGGRAVLHDRELTYSVICHEEALHFPDSILGTYKVISSCLVKGLNSLGIDASLTPSVKKEEKRSPSACFTSTSHYEITVDGKKLVGSAQRRGEGVFLQHGSILLEFDKERLKKVLPYAGRVDKVTSIREHIMTDVETLISSMTKGFEEYLGISLQEGCLSESEMALSEEYAKERYSRPEWNLRMGSACWAPTLP